MAQPFSFLSYAVPGSTLPWTRSISQGLTRASRRR
jgi:hypothetical protein